MKADVVVVKVEPGEVVEAGQVCTICLYGDLLIFEHLEVLLSDAIFRWLLSSLRWRWRWLCRLQWAERWRDVKFDQIWELWFDQREIWFWLDLRILIWSERNQIWSDMIILIWSEGNLIWSDMRIPIHNNITFFVSVILMHRWKQLMWWLATRWTPRIFWLNLNRTTRTFIWRTRNYIGGEELI